MSAAYNALLSEVMTGDEKSPPKQTRLGWGTLRLVGWATRQNLCVYDFAKGEGRGYLQ
jgi:hypothetical protein